MRVDGEVVRDIDVALTADHRCPSTRRCGERAQAERNIVGQSECSRPDREDSRTSTALSTAVARDSTNAKVSVDEGASADDDFSLGL